MAERSDVSALEDTNRRMPHRMKLEKLPDKTSEKSPESVSLRILVVTWNLMGTLPS